MRKIFFLFIVFCFLVNSNFAFSSNRNEYLFKCFNEDSNIEFFYLINENVQTIYLNGHYDFVTKLTTKYKEPLIVVNWNLNNREGSIWAVTQGGYGVEGNPPLWVRLSYFDFKNLKTISTSINPSLDFGPNQNTAECKFEDIK